MEEEIKLILKLAIVVVPVAAFLFFTSRIKKSSLLKILVSLYLVSVAGGILISFGKDIYESYRRPRQWDFLSFWMNGKVAVSGANFYIPENYHKVPLPYAPSDEFQKEIIDVGFWYPPFSMFLFLPLALFNVSGAYLFWQILNLLLCLACINGVWHLFLKDHGLLSLLLVAVLMLGLGPTRSTFSYAQTNFWTLLLAGKWKALTAGILTLMILAALSVLAFGPDVFVSYLNNPAPDVPSWNYTETTNQSLLSTILRLSHQQAGGAESVLLNPWYIGISLLLTVVTVFVVFGNGSDNDDWRILSVLFLALIVYPGNQYFYSVFLIVPVALFVQQLDWNAKGRMVAFLMVFFAYFLSELKGGACMFYANLFVWLVCVALAARIGPLSKLGLVDEM
ncbi:hypothetical protein ANAEL_05985 [Anaerolineales bacterium]|nr:hypothetical protein ANAEL_05985 [Anaerolineales bacterium]